MFENEISNGILDIIVPSQKYYPDLDQVSLNSSNHYGDDINRVKWRIKQAYDFAYIMSYSSNKGVYYLQLEDDVLSSPNFITKINEFIEINKENKWILMVFSKLGFIGKMFKIEYLPLFIHHFIAYATEKPVDWLLDDIFFLKNCNKTLVS